MVSRGPIDAYITSYTPNDACASSTPALNHTFFYPQPFVGDHSLYRYPDLSLHFKLLNNLIHIYTLRYPNIYLDSTATINSSAAYAMGSLGERHRDMILNPAPSSPQQPGTPHLPIRKASSIDIERDSPTVPLSSSLRPPDDLSARDRDDVANTNTTGPIAGGGLRPDRGIGDNLAERVLHSTEIINK